MFTSYVSKFTLELSLLSAYIIIHKHWINKSLLGTGLIERIKKLQIAHERSARALKNALDRDRFSFPELDRIGTRSDRCKIGIGSRSLERIVRWHL